MTASERIRAARENNKHLVSALPQTPRETRETEQHSVKVSTPGDELYPVDMRPIIDGKPYLPPWLRP